ncbi:LysR family transcriptional regulator [Shewanella sp. AS16]|uniref:LysR family transcriptional regulator n=1 Tax=Shewanella sp. AS16 TaxID=2907625 RepID=UPI001F1D505A|nr:LysR family transcriptional regulator [Shewanella sp. AS16]MCE9687154.1 LysR family transcriptional regulator [Shewanella sp. AS16]
MFKHLPSLTSIKAFEASARLKSFKLAAEELNVSPTAISHQIRSLEDALHLKLFLRHTRSVSLTSEGELLADTATRVLRELMLTVNVITETADTLRISTTNSFAAMWLVPNLGDFHNMVPKIDIQIRADDELNNLEADKGIDMVIRYGTFTNQPEAELLINESQGCFATPRYWQDLNKREDWTFLCVKWKNTRLTQQNYQELLEGVVPDNKHFTIRYYNDENQILQAALAGQGIAILSELLVKMPLSQGWLRQGLDEVSNTLTGLDYYCIIPERSRHNQTAFGFLDWLKNRIAC